MPLSAHERTILAGIADELNRDDPELSDLLRRRPPTAPAAQPRFPLSALGVGLLAVVLLVLVLVAPVAAVWGAAGLGLLTVALVVPWMAVAARAGARRTPVPEPDPGLDRVADAPAATAGSARPPRRTGDVSRAGRGAVLLVAAVWVLVLVLVAASHVGLANAALITFALAMLVGVHVLRWKARRALFRRYGTAGWDPRSDGTHRED